jgi:superfamily II DNA/RNA helicase
MTSIISTLKPFLQEHWEKAQYSEPTEIQQRAIPTILEGRDLIAESPTGTGKTLAYVLPALHRLDPGKKDAQVVILAPTRELVMQIHQVVQQWIDGSGFHVESFIGGADMKRQLEKLKSHPQVIVGTVNRVLELIKLKKLKMHEVKTFVLDEGDKLVVPESLEMIKSIIKTTMRDRQILFFSATLSEKSIHVAKSIMRDPVRVQIHRDEVDFSKVQHLYYLCEPREKADLLRRIVKMGNVKALAFLNDTRYFPILMEKLQNKNVHSEILSGELKKTERETVIKNFREDKFPILLTTDVAARGLDLEGLTHVIHYDFPTELDQYVHRSGRTGRQGAAGTVISFVNEREEHNLLIYARKLNLTIVKKGKLKART